MLWAFLSVAVVAPAGGIQLNEPFAVAFDRQGNWYICEHKGERIVRVSKDGRFAAFAGTGVAGRTGDGGAALQAQFRDPHGIVLTRDGKTMFVADTLNHQVRRIDIRSGIVTTLAGTGEEGFSGDGGPASKAAFKGVFGVALAADDSSLFVADLSNRRIRRIDLKSGVVTTVAGNGDRGVPSDGAVAAGSPLVDPRAVAVDSKGVLYILERGGHALRAVDRSGRIKTLIAPGQVQPSLNGPKHLCVDRRDRVVIVDSENHLIRRYDPEDGSLVTIAGTGRKGSGLDPADPLKTELNRPHGVVFDSKGNLFISDSDNHRVLRVSAK